MEPPEEEENQLTAVLKLPVMVQSLISSVPRLSNALLVKTWGVVSPGKVVGEGELWLGNPARCVRKLSEAEIERLYYSAQHYVRLKDRYLAETG